MKSSRCATSSDGENYPDIAVVKDASPREVTLWLPPWARLREQLVADTALHQLALRADHLELKSGAQARIARAFDILPRGLPVAALTRQLDTGDAMGFTWLRADPGHLRPDMATVRMLACGDLDLSMEECEALLKPLKPLFGDEGFPISAPTASRWYLCMPADVRLPEFQPPRAVIGDDLLAHLPEGEAGKRWRRLLNEVQVVLHNHPVNAERRAAGKLPVNTVWFWGAGRLPDHVRSDVTQLRTGDVVLRALALQAKVETSTDDQVASLAAGSLVDLHEVGDARLLETHWIGPLVERVARGDFAALMLDFGDGMGLRWRRAHRWRLWRRSLPA